MMACEIPPSLSMVDPNSKKESEKITAKRLDIMETFKFRDSVYQAINKKGLASHAIPVPSVNIAAHPSKNAMIESPQVEVEQ